VVEREDAFAAAQALQQRRCDHRKQIYDTVEKTGRAERRDRSAATSKAKSKKR
jgi:hypothetical protein